MTKRLTKKQKKENLNKRRFLKACKKYGMEGSIFKTSFGDVCIVKGGLYAKIDMYDKTPDLSELNDNNFLKLANHFMQKQILKRIKK